MINISKKIVLVGPAYLIVLMVVRVHLIVEAAKTNYVLAAPNIPPVKHVSTMHQLMNLIQNAPVILL
jgi:hypothetical protein